MVSAEQQRLKAMAAGAGLRLVASRKRTPGVGDFGRFGLTTAEGQECFGFAEDSSLTATAEEIAAFLHRRAQSQWSQSLAASASRTPARRKRTSAEPAKATKPEPRQSKPPEADRAERRAARPAPAPGVAAPEPESEPELRVRAAGVRDAEAIADLVRQLGLDTAEQAIARSLRALIRAKEPPLVAELGAIVGCVAYHGTPFLQHERVGRITLLVVAEDHRRAGIGTALLQAAEDRLRADGCARLEIANAITVRNASAFLRKMGYAERTYLHSKAATAD
jgi:N-acetylglutamate synthase-like GNAT family acetyltransferase